MNRFSTYCWLAAVLGLFPVGQSQWLSSGGLGGGRASAGEMEDIGEDEPHIGVNQGTGGSIDAKQTSNNSGGTVNTSGGGSDSLDNPSWGGSGVSISINFGSSFIVRNIPDSFPVQVFSDALSDASLNPPNGGTGTVSVADYTTWANNFGSSFGTVGGSWSNNFGNTGAPTRPAALSSVSVMMNAAAYTAWANHFGESGSDLPGDFNADGTVGIHDWITWSEHFGQFYTPPLAAGAAAARGAGLTAMSIPEPSGFLLLVMGLSSLILWRARRFLPF